MFFFSVGLHIHRDWTIPDCPNKLFYTNQEEEMWAILGRDGQLMSEQETLLYPVVMMMMMMYFSNFQQYFLTSRKIFEKLLQ
jgi:hypothetical protein